MFPVIEVGPDAPIKSETMGTKRKFWFQHSELGFSLFKLARPGTGEDWSEKIAEQLCRLLGLPHARYELAVSAEGPGVVTPSFVPDPSVDRLLPGNELLEVVPGYAVSGNKYRNSQHTLDLVLKTVGQQDIQLPPGWMPPKGVHSAIDIFVGYLLLDAWIGNTDRHHENWALVEQSVQGPLGRTVRYIAPTHDHASCLGCHETDAKRERHLTARDRNQGVEAYAGKAKSALYLAETDRKSLSTLEAYRLAGQRRPAAARAWQEQLRNTAQDEVNALFYQVPPDRISPTAVTFAQEILTINRQRLLGETEE